MKRKKEAERKLGARLERLRSESVFKAVSKLGTPTVGVRVVAVKDSQYIEWRLAGDQGTIIEVEADGRVWVQWDKNGLKTDFHELLLGAQPSVLLRRLAVDPAAGAPGPRIAITGPQCSMDSQPQCNLTLNGEWECVLDETTRQGASAAWSPSPKDAKVTMTLAEKKVASAGLQSEWLECQGKYAGDYYGDIQVTRTTDERVVHFKWQNTKIDVSGTGVWNILDDGQQMNGTYVITYDGNNGNLEGLESTWKCRRPGIAATAENPAAPQADTPTIVEQVLSEITSEIAKGSAVDSTT